MSPQLPIDHSKNKYYEAKQRSGMFLFHVYHYDATGNQVITIYKSSAIYGSEAAAYDACAQWLEDNDMMDAELS